MFVSGLVFLDDGVLAQWADHFSAVIIKYTFESLHEKSRDLGFAPSEDSDLTEWMPSLLRGKA